MRITRRQLRRIIKEEKRRLREALGDLHPSVAASRPMSDEDIGVTMAAAEHRRDTDDFRDPKTGESLWLVLNTVIDQMLTQGIDTTELANELRGLADDVEDSAPEEGR